MDTVKGILNSKKGLLVLSALAAILLQKQLGLNSEDVTNIVNSCIAGIVGFAVEDHGKSAAKISLTSVPDKPADG